MCGSHIVPAASSLSRSRERRTCRGCIKGSPDQRRWDVRAGAPFEQRDLLCSCAFALQERLYEELKRTLAGARELELRKAPPNAVGASLHIVENLMLQQAMSVTGSFPHDINLVLCPI